MGVLAKLWSRLFRHRSSAPAGSTINREEWRALRRPPHPANVPGPFYVEDGCCISCGVWEEQAPDLLAWFEDKREGYSHCYVAKQPETDVELERMIWAMDVAEVDCIRVHNCRPDWAARLIAAGHGMQIDPTDGPARG